MKTPLVFLFLGLFSATVEGANNCSNVFLPETQDTLALATQIAETAAREQAKVIEDLAPGTDKIRLVYSGYPSTTKLVSAPETIRFRHFTRPEFLESLRRTQVLKAGDTSYVLSHSDFEKEIFPDLKGVFLTTPDFSPDHVGLFSGLPYVDLTVPAGTGVLYLEPGIYLIPGTPGRLTVNISILSPE